MGVGVLVQDPRSVWVHDRFQVQYGFMHSFRTDIGSISVPGPILIHDRFYFRYGFKIGPRTI